MKRGGKAGEVGGAGGAGGGSENLWEEVVDRGNFQIVRSRLNPISASEKIKGRGGGDKQVGPTGWI